MNDERGKRVVKNLEISSLYSIRKEEILPESGR